MIFVVLTFAQQASSGKLARDITSHGSFFLSAYPQNRLRMRHNSVGGKALLDICEQRGFFFRKQPDNIFVRRKL